MGAAAVGEETQALSVHGIAAVATVGMEEVVTAAVVDAAVEGAAVEEVIQVVEVEVVEMEEVAEREGVVLKGAGY